MNSGHARAPHVDLLLVAGLIEVARRVQRRGAEERFYRATAREYLLDKSLLELDPDRDRSIESLVEVARAFLGGALEELTTGLRTGRRTWSRLFSSTTSSSSPA